MVHGDVSLEQQLEGLFNLAAECKRRLVEEDPVNTHLSQDAMLQGSRVLESLLDHLRNISQKTENLEYIPSTGSAANKSFQTSFDHLHHALADHADYLRSDDLEVLAKQENRVTEATEVVERKLKILHRDRALIQARLHFLRKTSPIGGLPTEILGRIFEVLYTKSPEPHAYDQTELFITTVAQVSSHWRQVAIGNPALWTRHSVDASDTISVEKLCAWLPRSKTLPVSITVYDVADDEGIMRFATAIRPELHRVASLEVGGTSSAVGALLDALGAAAKTTGMYSLRHLRTWADGGDGSGIMALAPSPTLFSNLKSLETNGFHWVGWEGWTLEGLVVTVQPMEVSEGLEEEAIDVTWLIALQPILTGLRNLHTLEISAGRKVPWFNLASSLDLPNLTEMVLHMEDSNMIRIFQVVDAPRLYKIKLEFNLRELDPGVEGYTFLSDFSERCSAIRDLTLIRSLTPLTANIMAQMIRTTPTLEHLTISEIAYRRATHSDTLSILPQAISGLTRLKSLRLEKGKVFYRSLAAALTQAPQRLSLNLSRCSIYAEDLVRTDGAKAFRVALLPLLSEWADVETWDAVYRDSFNGGGHGDFSYY